MENNQNEIVGVVENSSKKGLKKLALVAAGVVTGIGALILIKKRRDKKLIDQYDDELSNDSNESEEQ